jgi:hypothetical protein
MQDVPLFGLVEMAIVMIIIILIDKQHSKRKNGKAASRECYSSIWWLNCEKKP